MNKNAICTIVSLNYFAQARGLLESVMKYNKEIDLYILIVDKIEDPQVKTNLEAFHEFPVHINYISDLKIENIESMAFKYDLVEFNTALKPFYLEVLLNKYGYDSIIYLDSDILLFNNLHKVYKLLEENSIIITPHLISEEEDITTDISKIDDFLQYGVYNLGFIAIKNDKNGMELLRWWKEKLYNKCFLSSQDFLAWDQKWMDFAPALFESVYVLKDPGYNVAFWNIQKRFITKKDDIFYVNEKYELVFYHFSHYRLSRPDIIAEMEQEERCIRIADRPDLEELFQCYYNNVMKMDYNYYNRFTYGFSKFDNGEKIEKSYRIIYNRILHNTKKFGNPFISSNENCFYNFIKDIDYAINRD